MFCVRVETSVGKIETVSATQASTLVRYLMSNDVLVLKLWYSEGDTA